MRSRLRGRLALFGLVVCLAGAGLMAQTTSSTLVGRLSTEAGEPVEGAVVIARSADTGEVRNVITNAKGEYRFDLLRPGAWTVVARLADGTGSESRVVQLRLQETVRVDFTVGGQLTERVTVTAEPPLIDRKETAGKLRISDEQMNVLPLPGRVFTDLARLDSSVGSAGAGVLYGERDPAFIVNGQSGRSNSFLVDGLDNNDQTSGTNLNAFYSQLVIQEFVLMTEQYSPEFGRASGGVLNIVTKRGTNEDSWQFFTQGSVGNWNSSGQFVDSLPDSGGADSPSRFSAGASFGGAFKKDKAFYFMAFEHNQSDRIVPYTGIDREGVVGGRIVAPSKDDNFFFRTDFNLNSSNTLMVRLSADDRSDEGINVVGVLTPETGFRIDEQDLSLASSLTTVISPSLVNEVRFLAATSDFEQTANSSRPGASHPSGVFGGNNLNTQFRDETRFQIIENLTFKKNRHTMKFGFDVSYSTTTIETSFNPNGNFIYESDIPFEPGDCGDLFLFDVIVAQNNDTYPIVTSQQACGSNGIDDDGDGVIDEPGNIASYPLVYTYVFGQPRADLDDTRIALFAQDRWLVGNKLVLDYGLRYDLSTFTLGEDSQVPSAIPNGGSERDTNDLAPRFGFTYTPKVDGRWLIRGGYGKFFDKVVLGFPAVASITSGTEIALTFPQGLTFEVTEQDIEEEGIDAILPGLVFQDNLIMRFSTATQLETPYTLQGNVGVERSIGSTAAFKANAVWSRGYNLPRMRDLNPVVCLPDDEPAGCPIFPAHRDVETGSIAALTTDGRSWYEALDLSYRHQSKGGWFSASYTFSKAENDFFDPLKDGISLPADSVRLTGEKGRADGDRRHRLVLSGDYPLPWLGLRTSGVLQLSSGAPFNVTTGSDDNLDGILSDRPEGIGRNTGADTPLDVVNELRAEQGMKPVLSLSEPSFQQIDLRLYRPFDLSGGKVRGEVYFQIFNLLDEQNAALIEGRALSQNFGRVISLAGPSRTIELGLRFGS